jgi:hypothetical protein
MRISGLLSGFLILIANAGMAAAQDVPRFDVEAGCRGATKSLHQRLGQDTSLAIDERVGRCLKTEEDARERLKTVWARFSASDRTTCIGASSSGGAASYVELLVCLGMKEEVSKLRSKSNEKPTPPK